MLSSFYLSYTVVPSRGTYDNRKALKRYFEILIAFLLVPEDYEWYNYYPYTAPIRHTYPFSIEVVLAKKGSEIG